MNVLIVHRAQPLTISGETVDIYTTSTGDKYKVNQHGWLLEMNDAPVPEPASLELKRAIVAYRKYAG